MTSHQPELHPTHQPTHTRYLNDFVTCYAPENRHQRQESERFHVFTYHELLKRDKVSLDLFWLRDESLEGADAQPSPDILAASIVEDLQAPWNNLRPSPKIWATARREAESEM